MAITLSTLNIKSHSSRLDVIRKMRDRNDKLGINDQGKVAFYSGIHLFLHPQIVKRGADFLKSIKKEDITLKNLDYTALKTLTQLGYFSQEIQESQPVSVSDSIIEKKYWNQLQEWTSNNLPPFIQKLAPARFNDINTAAGTVVTSPDGVQFAANRIKIGNKNVAIASQYPKEAHLASYFKMLVENRTPALVVLASNREIDGSKETAYPLPAYFRENAKYSGVTVSVSEENSEQLGSITVKRYNMKVMVSGDKTIMIPVVHVTDWPDKTSLNAQDTVALVNYVNGIKNKKIACYQEQGSKAINDNNKLLPVIHCRAGVGRTGQLIAATELKDPESKVGLISVIQNMRTSRAPQMVQTEGQFSVLVQLANKLGKKLVG